MFWLHTDRSWHGFITWKHKPYHEWLTVQVLCAVKSATAEHLVRYTNVLTAVSPRNCQVPFFSGSVAGKVKGQEVNMVTQTTYPHLVHSLIRVLGHVARWSRRLVTNVSSAQRQRNSQTWSNEYGCISAHKNQMRLATNFEMMGGKRQSFAQARLWCPAWCVC